MANQEVGLEARQEVSIVAYQEVDFEARRKVCLVAWQKLCLWVIRRKTEGSVRGIVFGDKYDVTVGSSVKQKHSVGIIRQERILDFKALFVHQSWMLKMTKKHNERNIVCQAREV